MLSLFAIGGGNSAVPEMHRYSVDVQHWLTDRQFGDTFALAQLTPGPNLIIVDFDRLSRRRRAGCGGHDTGDVRAKRRVRVFCRPRVRPFQGAYGVAP